MVCRSRRFAGWLYLVVGLMCGLVLGLMVAGSWPSTPLHAVATDRSESFGIATGPVDEMTEAIYFMDYLTGDLSAVTIGKNPSAGTPLVTGVYGHNVMMNLKVDPTKNPKFLMVTGMADLGRGRAGNVTPSRAVLYVAEVTTGRCAAYAIPFNANLHKSGKLNNGTLVPVAMFPFRTGAAPGAGGKAKIDEE